MPVPRPRPLPPWMLLAVLLAAACGAPRPVLEATVDAYIRAVQERDARRLAELSAGFASAARTAGSEERAALLAEFESVLDRRLADYLTGREVGAVDFSPDGVVLIRALNLGRGTYYETVDTAPAGTERALLVQEVRLAYDAMDFSRFPVGTTLYLLGEPLGTIYTPRVGERVATVRRLLDRLWLRWTLVRIDDRWRVESVVPDPERPPSVLVDTRRH